MSWDTLHVCCSGALQCNFLVPVLNHDNSKGGCACAADYAKAVGRVSKGFQAGLVSTSSLVTIGAGYMVLVVLAVLTNSLALHLPLIYYKQRRSKVRTLPVPRFLGSCQLPGLVFAWCQL